MLVRDGATVTAKNVEVRGVSIPPPPSDMVPVTGRTIAEIERDIYRLALHRFPGDTEGIMKELGISRSTYFRRLADYGWDGQHPPPK
jgi:DNA-binding NtrC family response regulator